MPYRNRPDNNTPQKSSLRAPTTNNTASIPSKHLPSEKLQKVLAEAGQESRRSLERWIEAGRVSVNGVRARLGDRVQANDIIRVDGYRIFRKPPGTNKLRVLRYHKRVGEICSRADPEERRTAFDRLPIISWGRWISVGRLDINTSGLLLFTNIGELAHRLMHPSSGIEREYAVRVLPWIPEENAAWPSNDTKYIRGNENKITPEMISRLRKGVQLEDGVARFERIIDAGGQGQNHWYHVLVKEGRNHEVRRLWETVGLKVSRLIRIRYGPIRLGRDLRPGRWEELSLEETTELAKSVDLGELLQNASPQADHRKPTIARRRIR
uniref:23S rRNA pseudouridine2605 synthase n=1 Tax=Candidatus Kentrum sp. MB TaxID=2138164 RepID=A0A450XUL4_9GAMM|nr:MAG: 23S rRNA pseudouridine2605 synthase [Candidatus Kentron sp. MB]VFK32962.1 MAG: 23S rRNA pseudouridine2605 synthase [Candidatus Kentron sp. MB]VFK75824.1 MAG: 23S rRNA pseudouridine2605 synthase [Candidatus Kentron sp. MB]